MSTLQSFYQKARVETCKILGFNAKRLTPEQTMRLDCAVALRLALDDMQGRIIRGETVDVAKMLTASEALARLLPPTVLASPPPEHRKDPREVMLEIYLGMLERGELTDRKREPSLVEKLQAENAELRAAVAQLRSGEQPRELTQAEVIPPGEVGEFYVGDVRPGPDCDDPPKRSPVVIEGEAAPVPEVPAYDYNANSDWKNYVLPDGTITPTPFGSGRKFWGGV